MMPDSGPAPSSATASGPRSVATGGDISGLVFTGDIGGNVYIGEYERLEDVRQYADGLVAELDLPHFAGRGWLLEIIDEFLRSADRGYFVLEADAGLGKTAFCAWLARTRGYPQHFARLPGGADTAAALKNLAAQLITKYQLHEAAPGGVLPPAAGQPNGFARLLAAAAGQAQRAGQPLVLVVDGLDEVPHRAGEMPLGLPASLPPGVYVVVSRRPGDQMLPIEAPKRYVTLQAWAEPGQPPVPNQQDMLDYLRQAARDPALAQLLAAAGLPAEAFTDQLAAKCAGVWIYLRYVLAEMRQQRRSVADLATLPDNLWRYYAGTFARSRQEDPDRWQAALLPLLAALGAAREPVTFGLLCTLAGVHADERWRPTLDGPWRPFLQVHGDTWETEPRYAVYHASLREFLDGRLAEEALAQMTAERALVRQLHRALEARHNKIADRYLSAWGGLATDLPGLHELTAGQLDNGYGLRHLAAHLGAAGRLDDLHRLLSCQWTQPAVGTGSASRYVNTWFMARDRAGDVAGYLQDVRLAWQAAHARQEADGEPDAAGLGLELRYALIAASMVSLADSLPVPLITALVEHHVWPPAQALAYSRQLADPDRRASSLATLQPIVPPDQQRSVLAEALAAARQITDESDRIQALAALVLRLPADLLTEALDIVRQISSEPFRAQLLAGLAARLPTGQLQVWTEALTAAKSTTNEPFRAEVLSRIVPELPDALLTEALAAARQIVHHAARAQVLAALAPRMPDGLLTEALAAGRQDTVAGNRARILAMLAPQLPADQAHQVWTEVLAAVRHVTHGRDLARILATLAPQLPADLLAEALTAAQHITDEEDRLLALTGLAPRLPGEILVIVQQPANEYFRAGLLVALASGLPDDLLTEALTAAREVADPFCRAQVLVGLAPRLPAGQQQVWAETLATARAITKTSNRGAVLRLIASRQPAGQREQAAAEALATAWQLTGINREMLLEELAPWLPANLLPEALTAAREMADQPERALLLATLAPRLPAAQRQRAWAEALALAVTLRNADESEQLPVLETLIPQLPADLIPEALAAARQLTDQRYLAQLLAMLAARLPPGERQQAADEALAAARPVTDQRRRLELLAAVVARLPADLRQQAGTEALAAAEQNTGVDDYNRGKLLVELAPHVPADLLARTLAAVGGLTDEFSKGTALAALAPRLPAGLLAEALSVARQITDQAGQGRALAALAPRLPDDQRQQVWAELLAAVGPAAGWTMYGAGTVLAELAPQLPADLLAEATAVARQIIDQTGHGHALAALAPRLPDGLVAGALATAPQITEDYFLAQLLAALAPRLPDGQKQQAWAEALAAAGQLTDESTQAQRLIALVPTLPADLLPETLAAAGQLTDQSARALVLATLAPRLPDGQQQQAWIETLAVVEVTDRSSREEILAALAGSIADLPPSRACALMQEVFPALARRPRRELLACLRVLMAQPLGTMSGLLVGAAEAVISVSNWWP
jgi:hypothetical protein